MNTTLKILAAMTMVTVLASGCGTGSTIEAATAQPTTGESGVSPTGYRKPGAPVRMTYSVPPVSQSGIAVDIEVSFKFESPLDSADISVGDSQGMDILSARKVALDQMNTGDTHTMIVSVVPWDTGLHFVNVFADTRFQGRHLRRAFAVPIEIPGATRHQKSSRDVHIMPDGEAVISMPAQETQQD